MAVDAVEDDGELAVEEPQRQRAADDGRERLFPCHQCGAELEWRPGLEALSCPYCGHEEELPQDERSIREYAFNDYLGADAKDLGLGLEMRCRRCGGCGAEVELAADVAVQDCPFCGAAVADAEAHADRIRPEAVLPFAIEREQARESFRRWLRALWFAPGGLAQAVRADRFTGVYRPWWTFDSHTLSHWSGQAGYYYYVTRTRTVDGKTRTYQVRKVRWVSRSGVWEEFIDDELTRGFTDGLAADGYPLAELVPYRSELLAGFVVERYRIDPQDAWTTARAEIEERLRQACGRQLGGDTQRFLRVDTAHHGIAFKSLLLPVWHSTYRYRGRDYRIAINGANGRVVAERPWSWIKITFAVLLGLALLAGAMLLIGRFA